MVIKPGLDATSSPANRLIMPTEPRISLRNTLLSLPGHLRDDVLASHGIPEAAWLRLERDDDEGFIAERRAAMADRERIFMAKFGLAADLTEGETDIDTG